MLILLLLLLIFLLFPATGHALPPAYFPKAENDRLLFKTPLGRSSAILSVPPRSNGKLILYLHPTLGVDNWCAPSRADAAEYFNDDGMRRQLGELVRQGYSVLQPDYQGLGTRGVHPFFNVSQNMPAIKGSLRAAFNHSPLLDGDYLTIGYSQGATLALEAAHLSALLPGVSRGSVALAPPSRIAMQVKLASLINVPSTVSAFLIYLLRGYGYDDLLSKKSKSLIKQSRGMCVLEFSAFLVRRRLSPKNVLRPGLWSGGARRQFLEDLGQAEVNMPFAGRVLLARGKYDRVVFPSLVGEITKLSQPSAIVQKDFASGHFSLPFDSWPYVRKWIFKSFGQNSSRFYLPVGGK